MKKIYYFTFYKIYSVIKKTNNKDVAEWVAAILLGLFLTFNVFCLLYYSNAFKTSLYIEHATGIMIGIFLFFVSVNYIIFLNKDKYITIVDKSALVDKNIQIWGGIAVFFYVILTIVFLLYIVNQL